MLRRRDSCGLRRQSPTRERSRQRDRSERRKRADSAARSLAFRVFGIPHLANGMRLIHQPLQIVDESLAAVLRVLVMPSDVNRLFGAHLLAVTAEDAPELVDLEHERIAIAFLVLAGNELDAVGRAHGRA